MKNLKYFLLALSVMALISADLHAQTPRLVGGRRFVLDNNDLISTNNVYLVDNVGSLGINNAGLITGTFPNTNALLTLLAGSKTTNLVIDGGSTWGIDVVNTNNSIRTSGTNIFGDGIGNDATTINISGTGSLTLNGIPPVALPSPLANLLYLNGSNQVQLTPGGVNIVTGSGTLNTLPLWTPTGSQLGNSIITQPSGSQITIAGTNLAINGLNYTWPNVAATPNQVLTNNGAGVLSWATPAGGGGASIPFADFFALMPGDNAATVAGGIAVQFPQNGPSSGAVTRLGGISPSQFVITNAGTYEVFFQVSVTEAGQLMVRVNGALVASSVSGRATGANQIVGISILTLSAGDVIEVINPPGNAPALTITPNAGGAQAVSAHLVIKRLQ